MRLDSETWPEATVPQIINNKDPYGKQPFTEILYAARSTTDQMVDKYSPEFIRPFEKRNRLIVPAKMMTAVATKGHPPAVTGKPGMGLCGSAVSNCSRAGIEGVKIAFHPGGVHENVSTTPRYRKNSVRIGDEAAAGNALIYFGSVAANCI